MSDTETQRLNLVGVNPNSRSLKFLNTKNNIATLTLKKKLTLFERERAFSISLIDSQRHAAQELLKQVQTLEQDTEGSKRLLGREESFTPPPLTNRSQRPRRRKIRLAQTAPANVHHSDGEGRQPRSSDQRKNVKSGPETQQEKDRMLNPDRRKSMFIQLHGTGKQTQAIPGMDIPKKTELPKPNPKTLMEVMIGLNAFSYLPRARSNSNELSEYRGDSRMTRGDMSRVDSRLSIDQDSMYDSQENIAKSFMLQWKNKVASRKLSIINKLDLSTSQTLLNRSDSTVLSSVPEDSARFNQSRGHRKSKWTVRHQKKQPSLPAIGDDEERMEHFNAWVADHQAKARAEKESLFAGYNLKDQQSQRRRSFICWLQKRQGEMNKIRKESPLDDSFNDKLRDIIEYEGDDEDDDIGNPSNVGDLMRTLLKIKTRFKDPLDARVKRFVKDIEEIKERDDKIRNKEMTAADKRRWKMLIRGIDAALADSSEEEECYYNTI